jgi:hypothetical protein
MSTDDPIELFVLEEFRLSKSDANGDVARMVAGSRGGREPGVPLLTSIDDRRDVAMLRGVRTGESPEPDAAEHAALDKFVAKWQTPKHYGPRITGRSQSPPTSYRLAVTESGINEREPLARTPADHQHAGSTDVGLLWIGQPVGTDAGLLVLLGSRSDEDSARPDARDWPLPLSRSLGVRIYEGRA